MYLCTGRISCRAQVAQYSLLNFVICDGSFPALKKSRNFKVVSEALKDKLLCLKRTFFSTAASITEHQDLPTLTINVLQRVVKKEVLEIALVSASIDLSRNENILPASQVDIDFATTDDLKKRLKSCLELLVEKQQIPGSVADRVLEEY
ncbi:hypothetical protein PR048_013277 [Dryococelus australis]|uniref:Uncharacterized protein n=1 Tax=Dryococelus australis TaxID=614101 RepID=A0ABQ9HS57_9NEOP|nr:hypothetical protein PR048_013277 [Dryococelus australis]